VSDEQTPLDLDKLAKICALFRSDFPEEGRRSSVMAKLPWYKRDPDAALGGMFELTLEERGAYNTVLDLIYARSGHLPDDDGFLAGWMRCDRRIWKRIKARLIELGKIYIVDGEIHNSKADEVVLTALSRALSISELNRSKGRKSGEVRRRARELAEPGHEPNANRLKKREVEGEREEREVGERLGRNGVEKQQPPESPNARGRAREESRGAPLSREWQPSEKNIEDAIKAGVPRHMVQQCAAEFRDYWIAIPGQKGRKLDWDATFRNSIPIFLDRHRIRPIVNSNGNGSATPGPPERKLTTRELDLIEPWGTGGEAYYTGPQKAELQQRGLWPVQDWMRRQAEAIH
jgi:uncharacterized protein YdaU (DUF1376 family)